MVYPAPHVDYFEGVLQLRGINDEIISWVFRTTKKDRKGEITKMAEYKHGVDLYFSDQRYLRALGKKLREKYKGILKSTRTIHTERDSRAIYRVTVLFRYFPFSKGDKMIINDEEMTIANIGNNVTLQNQKGKKTTIKMESLCP